MANLDMPEGLTNKDLECVMLDLPSMDVSEAFDGGEYPVEDLYFSTHPDLKYAQGDVAAGTAHVTLLFGIHPSETYAEDVEKVLTDWYCEKILIHHVGFFGSRIEGEDYYCIIGHVVPTGDLLSGRRRLEALPHTSTYPEYRPHVTLAYIRKGADLELWIQKLNDWIQGTVWNVTGINLGLEE